MPIHEHPIRHPIQTGIEFSPLIPGVVPLYYEIEACNRFGFEYFTTWQDQSPEVKALYVAHLYTMYEVETHRKDAENRQAERDAKRRR
jgi:hypothetical protein